MAAIIVPLEGLVLLVFTGGIGEHDAGHDCSGLSWLGVSLDPARNQSLEDQRSSLALFRPGAPLGGLAFRDGLGNQSELASETYFGSAR